MWVVGHRRPTKEPWLPRRQGRTSSGSARIASAFSGWPIGAALLETLADINGDVQEALADERARLSEHGYPDDLPLPALWWNPARSEESEAEKPLLAAVAVTAGSEVDLRPVGSGYADERT